MWLSSFAPDACWREFKVDTPTDIVLEGYQRGYLWSQDVLQPDVHQLNEQVICDIHTMEY